MPDAKRNVASTKSRPQDSNDLAIVIPVFNKVLYQKSTLPYQNKTLLEYQIITLLEIFPKGELFVVVGHEGDRILKNFYKKYPIRFLTNDLYLNSNIAYALKLAVEASFRKSLLVVHPNVVFDRSLQKILSKKSTAVVGNGRSDQVGVFLNKSITGFSYSFEKKWSNIVCLTGRECDLCKDLVRDDKHNNLFDFEILNKIIERGGEIFAEEINTKVVEGIKDL